MEQGKTFRATVATHTDAGAKKSVNEDAIGYHIPEPPLLTTKGVVAVVADGVSSAEAGREAARRSVAAVLEDYYGTPELWSVKHAIQKTLSSLNRELYDLGREMPDEARGYICTLSMVVIKSHLAYLFHAGDSRIYRLSSADGSFTQLTSDHVAAISNEKQYLIRAMGMDTALNIDASTVEVSSGDIFYLDSDGIHDFLDDSQIQAIIEAGAQDLDGACQTLVSEALAAGSDDNLSCCLLRIDKLGVEEREDFSERLTKLPFPPELHPGLKIDGYEVIAELWASERSQLYSVRDVETGTEYVMKTPSATYDDDPAYIERFIAEEWIGSRIHHPRVVGIIPARSGKQFLYYLMEKVPGITLQQWIAENPEPRPSVVARLILDIAEGLFAMHAEQVVHQDLKPGNIMLTPEGEIKIVDFGAVYAPGLQEIFNPFEREIALGTLDYADPAYRFGINTFVKGDIYSLAVIAYEMFTGGSLPYGKRLERCKTQQDFETLEYIPSYTHRDIIPLWFDRALEKGCMINPALRYARLEDFIHDLQHPNPDFLRDNPVQAEEGNTVFFWKMLSFFWLSILIVVLVLFYQSGS